ncbi:transglutaminase family protein [Microbulbifer hainanensis]|uniref:transglutaminase family protein n=1 Tax=Microbulbifer hainanensis TaxID=2735675 RepID=UPI001868A689|nr:transglutaminase family protein [Microbulbifer hainanensis]
MIYRVRHTTRYRYDSPVSQCYNLAHLLPRDSDHQQCLSSSISVVPQPEAEGERRDYFGNRSYQFAIQMPHREMDVSVVSEVRVNPRAPMDLRRGPTCEEVRVGLQRAEDGEVRRAREFTLDSPMIKIRDSLRDFAVEHFVAGDPFPQAVLDLSCRIHREFNYDPAATTVATPLHEVLERRSGVCQDFAHLAIGCLRSLGFAARYISGYLETLPPPGQVKLVGADASHAWFAVYVPGSGWLEFDPTNDQMANEQYIATAWGRDYSDVTPLKGILYGGSSGEPQVAVDVNRMA